MIRPSIRISMLSYNHMTTFCFCEVYKTQSWGSDRSLFRLYLTCCRFLKITFWQVTYVLNISWSGKLWWQRLTMGWTITRCWRPDMILWWLREQYQGMEDRDKLVESRVVSRLTLKRKDNPRNLRDLNWKSQQTDASHATRTMEVSTSIPLFWRWD